VIKYFVVEAKKSGAYPFFFAHSVSSSTSYTPTQDVKGIAAERKRYEGGTGKFAWQVACVACICVKLCSLRAWDISIHLHVLACISWRAVFVQRIGN